MESEAKTSLWLLITEANRSDVPAVVPTVAWMAKAAGATFETYLEDERDGRLFARSGSTILGGHHHQQFNYLNAAFDVKCLLLGNTHVFDSSIHAFNAEILAETDGLLDLYAKLLATPGVTGPGRVVFVPDSTFGEKALDIAPYLFPEIYFSRTLAVPAGEAATSAEWVEKHGIGSAATLFLDPEQTKSVQSFFPNSETIDALSTEDDYGSVTLRIASRWKSQAKGVAFGDPPMIRSLMATCCRESRVAIYAPKDRLPARDVRVSAYTEETSPVAVAAADLAIETDDRVIIGRQTGDGDIFQWSRQGVCIQISDPNRPAFPVVREHKHPWREGTGSPFDDEPDDATLRRYAEEGKILTTLIWHSGEVAHNEAMLNLFDVSLMTGFKMGIGVHAARYETCPQMWELVQVPRANGGVKGLIEPVLHSGGMGVMAECHCPPAQMKAFCEEARERIRVVAGDGGVPKGHYCFMDSDLATLSRINSEGFAGMESAGLEYVVSSAWPGRNRVLWESDGCIALNQSCRSVCGASPFIRIGNAQTIKETAPRTQPGWFIAALDSPVVSFTPYIWREGSEFMKIIDDLQQQRQLVNVLPHTIARYARLIRERVPGRE